jgi:hypothetical protein
LKVVEKGEVLDTGGHDETDRDRKRSPNGLKSKKGRKREGKKG